MRGPDIAYEEERAAREPEQQWPIGAAGHGGQRIRDA